MHSLKYILIINKRKIIFQIMGGKAGGPPSHSITYFQIRTQKLLKLPLGQMNFVCA